MEGGVLQARSNPRYLHSNSTSHVWMFSAFAELIDNAYDVQAKELRIDVEDFSHPYGLCVSFVDNGSGMTKEKLYNMLSFGYCEKEETFKLKPVGQYGNGFKSGSMRIGKDALVFTKEVDTMSVGLLSQTYLEAIGADTIYVPIVTWNKKTKTRIDDSREALDVILAFSLFETEHLLIDQFESIGNRTGTKIIIYNLSKTSDGKCELDFSSDSEDIRIDGNCSDMNSSYSCSLREYCSVLFLFPSMKLILRGKKVEVKILTKSLQRVRKFTYKPRNVMVPINIAFGVQSAGCNGVMLYCKNRLIKGYVKVGCQRQKFSSRDARFADFADSVVGVVEVDSCYLEPIHNKQDFRETKEYMAFMNNLGIRLNAYCESSLEYISNSGSDRDNGQTSFWVQCDDCNKWRKLSADKPRPSVHDRWTCSMNDQPNYNSCEVPQEDLKDEIDVNCSTAEFRNKRRMGQQNGSMTKRRRSSQVYNHRGSPPDVSSGADDNTVLSNDHSLFSNAENKNEISHLSNEESASLSPDCVVTRCEGLSFAPWPDIVKPCAEFLYDRKPDVEQLSRSFTQSKCENLVEKPVNWVTVQPTFSAAILTSPDATLRPVTSVFSGQSQARPPISFTSCMGSRDVDLNVNMQPNLSLHSESMLFGSPRPSADAKNKTMKDVEVQTDLDTRLIDLRRNVLELLKACVPSTSWENVNLNDESVDELVLTAISHCID